MGTVPDFEWRARASARIQIRRGDDYQVGISKRSVGFVAYEAWALTAPTREEPKRWRDLTDEERARWNFVGAMVIDR